MKRILLAAMTIVLMPFVAGAQQAAQMETNPVSNGVRKMLERESKNLVAAAEEMPADKYSFSPTPQQMTFGKLVVHMIHANYHLCSMISGAETPKMDDVKDTDAKDKLVGTLKSSFEFCTSSLVKVDDSKLGEQVPFFGGKTTSRGNVMLAFAEDFGDHYSMAAMYLRLNGLLPPTAKQKE
jgi:uncharacterized damage-inducible protein DinB